ncbi:MAG: hypothetical protein KatS3mg114_1352 [Planctomycetaceae bacterium]|nr:MAG: hypothetical protein KatS3mg114_1352 [Planctomycetaceae bacterium]
MHRSERLEWMHDLPQGWTAGAARALIRAAQLAEAHQAESVQAWHLLWSLVFDEGRAGAQLSAWGLTPDKLSTLACPVPFDDVAGEHHTRYPGRLAWDQHARTLVFQALQRAYEEQPNAEASTEHLLWSLCQPHAPTATWLARWQPTGDAPVVVSAESSHVPAEAVPAGCHLTVQEPSSAGQDVYRLLDAAANRAREGLRVLEDYVRFVWNDRMLTAWCKQLRHALTEVMACWPRQELLAARDTPGDVGTDLAGRGEYTRATVGAVLSAAACRTQEALRSLEEFCKLQDEQTARRLEQLRYQVYALESVLCRGEVSRQRLADHRLCLLLTEQVCPRGAGPVLHAALQAGVKLIQIREKNEDDRRLFERCRWARQITREYGALLIINDRPDLAVLVDADGVHVGQDDLPIAEVRRIVGGERLVGVSTHSIEQAERAVRAGADYLGVGPVFSSRTKTFEQLAGLEYVRQISEQITLPWFAIGGIDEKNVQEVLAAGATRVAVSQAICAAEDPAGAAQRLLQALAADADHTSSRNEADSSAGTHH